MNFKKIICSAIAFAALSATSAQAVETVKVGVVGPYQEQWEHIRKVLKPEGVNIELVRFSDYILPQPLAQRWRD